ncbi:MAG: BMP family ABC transporter substrate-binding protein [Chloroflexaceae bacterium]|jgi:basic membrane lipoprotein Med (substrate-binding protein (PBP1-ABC) superfamily)|nr:BMP family ABC transporter substrate-binding protein [Chloroflexaceae bacterium]
MRQTLLRLLVLFGVLVPLIAACGQTPAQTPAATTAPVAQATTAPTAAPAATAAPTAAAAATAAPTAAAAATTAPAAQLKVGLVTDLGKVNDGTFNEFAHKGAERAAQEFGLEYKYIETVAQADYEKNIQTLINEDFDIIVTVGFLIAEGTLKAAQANPDVKFIGVDQFYPLNGEAGKSAPNLVGLQFREDQAGFMAGAMAGMMTQSGTVGVVAGIDIPPVKRFANAFKHGAEYVRPGVNVLITYVPSFTDPAAGASTATQMIGEGADVIFGAGGPTGSGGIKAAAEAGAFVIGVDQDEFTTTFGAGQTPGADRILTSAIKRVDVSVYDEIKNVVNGTFKGDGIALYDAAADGVGYADFHQAASAIPDGVKTRMEAIFAKLADGSLTTGVDPVSGDVDEATIPAADPYTP